MRKLKNSTSKVITEIKAVSVETKGSALECGLVLLIEELRKLNSNLEDIKEGQENIDNTIYGISNILRPMQTDLGELADLNVLLVGAVKELKGNE